MEQEKLLQREDKIKCMNIDRDYDYKMEDAEKLKHKMELIKSVCKPGAMIGVYKVITPYKNQCRFLFPNGTIHCLTYLYLAQHSTIKNPRKNYTPYNER